MRPKVNSNTEQEILGCIFSGNTSRAVKIYRVHSGKGLRESKQYIDSLVTDLKKSNPAKFAGKQNNNLKRTLRDKYAIPLLALLLIVSALTIFVDKSIFAPFAWILLFFLGIDVFVVAIQSTRKVFSAKKWPKVKGGLIAARVVGGRDNENWGLDLEYEYLVNGRSFRGNNYNWVGVVAFSKKGVEKIIDDVNANKDSLNVYYNPSDCKESVLHSTLSVLHVIGILIGPVICLVAAFGLLGKFT